MVTDLELSEKRNRVIELGHETAELVGRLSASRAALRESVLDALASGVSENETAKLAGLTRDTVRRWAGK